MKKFFIKNILKFILLYFTVCSLNLNAQGNYATDRQLIPVSANYKTDNIKSPIPTNDWWTQLICARYTNPYDNNQRHSGYVYPYPLCYKTYDYGYIDYQYKGLAIGLPKVYEYNKQNVFYGFWDTAPYKEQIFVTVGDTSFNDAKVDDYSDWTVSLKWEHKTNQEYFKATFGQGLIFTYFEFSDAINPEIHASKAHNPTFKLYNSNGTSVTSLNSDSAILECDFGGAKVYYGIFAHAGTQFTLASNKITIILPLGNKYLSVGIISSNNLDGAKTEFSTLYNHAYAFVTNTQVDWVVNEPKSLVTTNFKVTTESKQYGQSSVILGLFPHQWKNSSNNYLTNTFDTIRGNMKLIDNNSFSVTNNFHGIIPMFSDIGTADSNTLKGYLDEDYYSLTKLNGELDIASNNTYWAGKKLWKAVSLIPIAEQLNDQQKKEGLIDAVKEVLINWYKADDGTNEYFYYESTIGTLVGSGNNEFGSQTNINDHHFHYGYFIYASAILAMYDNDFANEYHNIIDLLIRDIASPNRNDLKFPFLRTMSVYEGHTWANGLPKHDVSTYFYEDGNNQESSSEAMNAWAGIYLWGLITNNEQYKELGIWGHTTEYSAIREYYFDIDNDIYPSFYEPTIVSILWGGKASYEVFFGDFPEYKHGIQYIPITPSSLYLGYDTDYVQKNNDYMLNNPDFDGTKWHDLIWQYLGFNDPQAAINAFNNNSSPDLESVTKTYLYYWLHNLNNLGHVDTNVYADDSCYAVFDKNGQKTYVCYNFTNQPKTINFYDRNTNSLKHTKNLSAYNTSINIDEYIIKLNVPHYTPTQPYSSYGAASAQMILNYIEQGYNFHKDPSVTYSTQDKIYKQIYPSPQPPYSELTGEQIENILENSDPYGAQDTIGYHFALRRDTNGDINNYLRNMCYWLGYEVPYVMYPNVPVIAPVENDPGHWVVINGCVTDIKPSSTTTFTIFGFWINDPAIENASVYKTAASCIDEAYFTPIDGEYIYIAEPLLYAPSSNAEVHIKKRNPVFNKGLSALSIINTLNIKDIIDKELLADPDIIDLVSKIKLMELVPGNCKNNGNTIDCYVIPCVLKNNPNQMLACILLDTNGKFIEFAVFKEPVAILSQSQITNSSSMNFDSRSFKLVYNKELGTNRFDLTWSVTQNDGKNLFITQQGDIFALEQGELQKIGNINTLASINENFKIYPNPYKPASHLNGAKFCGLRPNSKVKIYTLIGELVDEFIANTMGNAVWYGTNKHNKLVASGIYLCFVNTQKQSKKVKKIIIQN